MTLNIKNMKPFLLNFLIIVALACNDTSPLPETKFYISNDGSDRNSGTSPLTPWKTISKINSMKFKPGDSILFKCGDRWEESLIIPSNGTSKNHIVFSSYGKGAKPKLYGSKPVTSFSKHSSLPNVYKCNESVPINPNNYDKTGYVGSIFYIIEDSVTWGDGLTQYRDDITKLKSNGLKMKTGNIV